MQPFRPRQIPALVLLGLAAYLGACALAGEKERFWALILPEGASALEGSAAEHIREWVEGGGRLMLVYNGGWRAGPSGATLRWRCSL